MKKFLPFLLFIFFMTIGNFTAISQSITVIAEGLTTPVGIDYIGDEDGDIFIVSEAGSGNGDGQVSFVIPDEAPLEFIDGLPSWLNPDNGETSGPWRISAVGDLLVVVQGEGPDTIAESLLFFDLLDIVTDTSILGPENIQKIIPIGPYARANGAINSNPYSMTIGDDGFIYVVDAGANAVFKVDPVTDSISTFATFPDFENPTPVGPPMVNTVPTRIFSAGELGFIVSSLTGFPFVPGAAKVFGVSPDGTVVDFVTGLSLAVDMAVDPTDGNLVILQFATFGEMGFEPNSAQLIKLMPDLSLDTMAMGFGPSGGVTFDTLGNAYVTSIFTGQILKIDPSATTAIYETPTCDCGLSINPNPVRDQATINYNLPESGDVTLRIYNAMGGIITTLVSDRQSAGDYVQNWNVADHSLAPGAYLGVITVNGKLQVTKFMKQ